jgi:CheY-like chemotaxis protein/CRP-like cAMP-binding protein
LIFVIEKFHEIKMRGTKPKKKYKNLTAKLLKITRRQEPAGPLQRLPTLQIENRPEFKNFAQFYRRLNDISGDFSMNKLLIIEDHLEVRENLQELLELCNYTVLCAPNGETGIRLALTEQPDLILCDIMMPGLDGYEVLAYLAQQPETAAIPFIFLTAKADKADIRRGMQLGADDYITKPFEEEELLKAIQVRLHKSHLLKQPFQRSSEGLQSFLFQARQEGGLPPDAHAAAGVRRFEPNQFIFHEGESPQHLFFIASGSVCVYRPDQPEPGRVSTTYEKGSFFGYKALIQGTPYLHRAETIAATEISLIPKSDFYALLLHNRTFSIRFIQLLANQVRDQEKQLLKMVQELSKRKVAGIILELFPVFEKRSKADIPLETIQSQARMANLNINLALRYLHREKAICLQQDCIQLLDTQKLRALVNG